MQQEMPPKLVWKSGERPLLAVLSIIHFTIIVDFLIMMPLGPQYMRVFGVTARQFGFMVSAYALSASVAGILACFFLDRFDRKRALQFLFFWFAVGTLCCALAKGYYTLTAARLMAGAFGGVTGATILSILGDVIPEQRRGAAMGMVMSAFSLASIIGVPAGLFLANHFGWHAPFYVLAGFSFFILGAVSRTLPPINGHLRGKKKSEPWRDLKAIVVHPNHILAFIFMALLVSASFLVIPFLSPYMVKNVGLKETDLPYIYISGGLLTFFSMNWVGRMADRYGKLRMYVIMALGSIVPIIAVTSLPRVSVVTAIATTTLFMICMSGRFVPAMALIVASVEPVHRGAFMSLNSSVQNFASGLAASVSGMIIGQEAGSGALTGYWMVGLISAVFVVLGTLMATRLKPARTQDESMALPVAAV
jgi:predicted MFS family arabinose efflux permease